MLIRALESGRRLRLSRLLGRQSLRRLTAHPRRPLDGHAKHLHRHNLTARNAAEDPEAEADHNISGVEGDDSECTISDSSARDCTR